MLEMEGVFAGYGSEQILRGLTARFEEGKLVSIVGANGCGKSTLLKTIIGILRRSEGKILLDGEDTLRLDRTEIARRIAYLPQGKETPDMTVEQMVLHGRFPHLGYPRRYSEKDREIARAAMESVGILALSDREIGSLSGGIRQNAYIAMALAGQTKYILLDEPTTYLDVSHQMELLRTLRKLTDGGRGIISVMHDLPLAFAFSDEIAVMNEGRIVMQAPPDRVCESGIVEKLFGVPLVRSDDGGFRYLFCL